MPGNRDTYEQYMNTGHSAAWDQEWVPAVNAYGRAIQEFPEDPEAHIHLGLALLNANRLEDALKVYKRAHQLAPDDPIPLEKSADVLERMGRLKEAAQQYINVSDVYLAQRDLDKAIGNWERATQLTPGLVGIHAKLAQAYERIGDNKKAINQYLTLSFNFQRLSETEKAVKAVERALRLDKNNPQALNTLNALKRGQNVILVEDDETAGANRARANQANGDNLLKSEKRVAVPEADPLGPMGEAMTEAMGLLAGFVIESSDMDVIGDAMQAMELQRQGIQEQAIAAYTRAEVKMRHPALKMNLGGLLLLADKPEEAVKHLGEAAMMPELQAGGFHALGWAYFKLGKQKLAAKNLIRGLQAVDTAMAMNPEEVAELTSIYDRLVKTLSERNDDALQPINDRFVKLLTGKDWKQRIAETRRHLEDTMREEGDQGIVDFLGAAGSDALTQSVSSIDRYIRQGLLILAMDEAHHAVEVSPTYLPVHVRMAEVMMREGRVRQAINKYNTVAKLYMVRGESDRAASILGEVLEMAPLDIPVRQNLIELLEKEERWVEVMDQYVGLADTYIQLGNYDQARETYAVAERVAKRGNAPVQKLVSIKHHIADIDQTRLDTRKAQRVYEEIIELSPGDERALKTLVELYYAQGNQLEALKRLDQLLSLYAKTKQVPRMSQILEELVKRFPNDSGVRTRLAQFYKSVSRKDDAIAQLDALADMQLEAGMHKEAVKTIKQIIAIGPKHIEDYRRLLSQLGDDGS